MVSWFFGGFVWFFRCYGVLMFGWLREFPLFRGFDVRLVAGISVVLRVLMCGWLREFPLF